MADVRIRWVLDVVDRGVGSKLVAENRAVMSSVKGVDAAYGRLSSNMAGATASIDTTASASAKLAESLSAGTAAAARSRSAFDGAASAASRLNATQAESAKIGSRVAAVADGIAGAYRRVAVSIAAARAEESRFGRAVRGAGRGISAAAGGAGSAVSAGAGGLAALLKGAGVVGLGVGAATVVGLKKASTIAGEAAGISGQTGVSAKEAAALAIVARSIQVNTRQLGVAFSTLGKQVTGYEKGTKSSVELFESLKISPQQISQMKNNLPLLFDTVYKATKNLPEAQRAADIKTLLGRGGAVAGRLESLGPISEQIKGIDKQLGGIDPKKLEDLHVAESKLREETTLLELQFASTFGPPLIKLMELITPAIKPVGEAVVNLLQKPMEWLAKNLPGIFEEFGRGFKGLGPKQPPPGKYAPTAQPLVQEGREAGPFRTGLTHGGLTAGTVTTVQAGPYRGGLTRTVTKPEPFAAKPEKVAPEKEEGVFEKIGKAVKTIGQGAEEAGAKLLKAFQPAMPFLKNVALPLVEGLGKGLVLAFNAAIPVIELAAKVLGFFGDLLKPLAGPLKAFGTALGFVFSGAILGEIADFIGIFGKLPFIGKLFDAIAYPIRKVGDALSWVLKAAVDLVPKIVSKAADIASGIAKGLGDLAPKVAGKIGDIAGTVGKALGGVGSFIARSIGSAFGSAVKLAGDLLPKIGESIARSAPEILSKLGSLVGLLGRGVVSLFEKVLGPAGLVLIAAEFGKALVGVIEKGFSAIQKIRFPRFVALEQIVGAVKKLPGQIAGLAGSFASAVAKIASNIANGIARGVTAAAGYVSRLPGRIAHALGSVAGEVGHALSGAANSAGKWASRIVGNVMGWIGSLPGKVGHAVGSAMSTLVGTLSNAASEAGHAASQIVGEVAGFIGQLPGRIAGFAKSVASSAFSLGKGLVEGIVSGIGSIGGQIGETLVHIFEEGFNKAKSEVESIPGKFASLVTGGKGGGGVVEPTGSPRSVAPGLPGGRGFQAGGLVPSFVSPGEQLIYGQHTMTVPGARTAADSVYMNLPVGTAVLTDHGQSMMAGGAGLHDALAYQMPHFARGGLVVRGRVSTFGPPLEEAHPTFSEVSSALPGIAVRPGATYQSGIPTVGKLFTVQIAGHTAVLRQTDIGPNQSTGRRIDVTGAGSRKLGIDPQAFPTDSIGVAVEGTPTAIQQAGGSAAAALHFPKGGLKGSKLTKKEREAKEKGTSGEVKVPLVWGKAHREGLLPELLEQAIEEGTSGLTIHESINALKGLRGQESSKTIKALAEAIGPVTRTENIAGKAGEGGKISGGKLTLPKLGSLASLKFKAKPGEVGASGRVGKMNQFAAAISSRWPNYQYAGGHNSSFTGPYDCSGFVSAILHYGGFLREAVDTTPLKTFGDSGPGRQIEVGVRGSSGMNAHTMMRVGRDYWEAGGSTGGRVGKVPGWDGFFPIMRHPRGYAKGGVVGQIERENQASIPVGVRRRIAKDPNVLKPGSAGFVGYGLQHGGRVRRHPNITGGARAPNRLATQPRPAPVPRGIGFKVTDLAGAIATESASLEEQATAGVFSALNAATLNRLEQMRKLFVREASKAGPASVIRAWQSAVSAVDVIFGNRLGNLQHGVEVLSKRGERAQAGLERHLRFKGIDPSSGLGLTETSKQDEYQTKLREGELNKQKGELSIAKRTKNRKLIEEVTERVHTAEDDLDEARTKHQEDVRALLRQKAQEAVEGSQANLESVQSALTGLDIAQKLGRTAELPGGLREHAAAIQGSLIPALQSHLGSLYTQRSVLEATHATASELHTATAAINTAANEIGSAMVEAAELIKQAAEQAAAETVEAATHTTTLVQTGLARLELEERIGQTFEAAGSQRAAYITSTLIPALTGELQALQTQLSVAGEQGDQKLATQIAEAIASKQNDILTAQLQAQEQIQQNTERKIGGTLGFTYGNETLTDALVSVGTGA